MSALWESGPLATPQVHALVGRPRQLAYTTVLTILQRLYRKGLLLRTESGKLHIYRPAITQEEFSARRGHDMAATFVELGASGAAALLYEAERLDPDLIALLRRLLGSNP